MNSKLGMALIVLGGIAIFAVASTPTFTTNVISAIAVLALAAGALISGTADEEGRPV